MRDLASLLGPRPRRQPSATPADPETASTPPEEPTTDAREDNPTTAPSGEPEPEHGLEQEIGGAPAGRRPVSTAADAHLRVSRVVYLTDDLVAEVGAACARDRITRTQLVLHALEATHQQLGDLVATDLEPKVIRGTLFDEVVTTHRQNQPAKRQVMIQPTRTQLEVIDKLVTDCGARDRSHLVAVALAAHLGH